MWNLRNKLKQLISLLFNCNYIPDTMKVVVFRIVTHIKFKLRTLITWLVPKTSMKKSKKASQTCMYPKSHLPRVHSFYNGIWIAHSHIHMEIISNALSLKGFSQLLLYKTFYHTQHKSWSLCHTNHYPIHENLAI